MSYPRWQIDLRYIGLYPGPDIGDPILEPERYREYPGVLYRIPGSDSLLEIEMNKTRMPVNPWIYSVSPKNYIATLRNSPLRY